MLWGFHVNWFDKMKKGIRTRLVRNLEQDLWVQCPSCQQPLYKPQIERSLEVCPECDCHFPMEARSRLGLLIDPETFEEMDAGMTSLDPLHFLDYREKLARDQKSTGMRSALVGGTGRMEGVEVVIGVTDRRFIMGSMGSVVGEKIKRLISRSLETGRPLILVSGSGGGARMQEGILSLMQMAKVSAMLRRLHDAKVPYVSVLTDPTGGGVTASFAMLGDVNLAEPGARIMFSGRPAIEGMAGQKVPDDFQTAEFCLNHGMIDMIVHRKKLKKTLVDLVTLLSRGEEKQGWGMRSEG